MKKIVLFDLDNTLLDFTKSENISLYKTFSHFNIKPEKKILEHYSYINSNLWKLLEQKKITHSELKIKRYKLLFEEFGFPYSVEQAANTYENFLSMECHLIEGAVELLENIYKKYDLYIVTNGITKIQESRIKNANLEKYFKDIFISEKIGYNKPDIRYFQYCLNKIKNFEKEKAVIIGDSLSSDIQGGINTDIKTIWFNYKKVKADSFIKPDYEIFSLKEIEKILYII